MHIDTSIRNNSNALICVIILLMCSLMSGIVWIIFILIYAITCLKDCYKVVSVLKLISKKHIGSMFSTLI